MATGASDGWRMNRRLSIGSTGATAWSFGPSVSLDLTPAIAPTPIGCSDASVAVLQVASVDHVFNSQSNLVKVTPVFTPMLFSLNHRNFRCLRVGGPARPVSLIPPAGPACQPLFLLFSTRTTALGLSLSTTRTPPPPRQCSPLLTAAAAGPQRRRLRTAPPPHARRRRTSPAPAPRSACARATTAPRLRRRYAAAAPLRRRTPLPATPAHLPHTPTRVHSRPFQVLSTLDSSAHKVFEELPLRLFLRFLP